MKHRYDNYHEQTLRPASSLAFVLPLILFYEIAAILLGSDATRSGIDQWLRQFLSLGGAGHIALLPIITIAILLIRHHRNDDTWPVKPRFVGGMIIESIGLGLIVFFAAGAMSMLGPARLDTSDSMTLPMALPFSQLYQTSWSTFISAIGSGIYEESVFRLMLLLPVLAVLRQRIGNRHVAQIAAVFLVSLLLAALHYSALNPAGSQFEVNSFLFRFFAGSVFSVLFLFRGFGIAVGTHIVYDILTQT